MSRLYNKVTGLDWKIVNSLTFMNGETYYSSEDEMEQGEFLNRNKKGLTVEGFNNLVLMRDFYKVAATYKEDNIDDDLKFVAILKHYQLPMYVFTYSIEFNQFHFKDNFLSSAEDIIDHTVEARLHC